MDQQRFMNILANHGPPVLESVVGSVSYYDSNADDDDDENVTYKEALLEFWKRKHSKIGNPTRKPKPNVFLKPDDIRAMPPELYRNRLSPIQRRQLFFKTLKRQDILYLQVINTLNSEGYKCLVLAKHGNLMKLDDLSIEAYFPKLKPELKLLNGELKKFDLIRGAFWSVSVWERKLFVTLDTLIFSEEEKEKIPKLGKITRKDLPHYVGCKRIGMTYVGYIQRHTGLIEPGHCMRQLQECLGVNTKRMYSFYKEYDGKTYQASESFAEICKKLHPDASNTRLYRSFEYFRNGNMFKALYYANKAIMFNPDNIQARVTRGTVYANLGKLKKAIEDTEDCLKLESKHESARKQMSELLVSASMIYIHKKKYFLWHQSLVLAKKYNPKNREVQELLKKAKYKVLQRANTIPSSSTTPESDRYLIPPSMADVSSIYHRIVPRFDKRRLLKQYKKQRRRKRRHERRRRRAERRKKRTMAENRPIPTTTATRRHAFFRPNAPLFRRPYPPRNISRT